MVGKVHKLSIGAMNWLRHAPIAGNTRIAGGTKTAIVGIPIGIGMTMTTIMTMATEGFATN